MHLYTDQMYVEHLVPTGNSTGKDPVVFLHGQAQTGTVSPYRTITARNTKATGIRIG